MHGAGHDAVDKEAASERGVLVCNTPGANARSVSELALGLALAVARLIPAADRSERAGIRGFREMETFTELSGKTALIVGWGATGAGLGRMLKAAFDARVLVYSPRAADVEGFERMEKLEDGLAQADLVSLHTPLRPETRGLGMVFQSYNLWPHMTVLENVIHAPIKLLKMPRSQAVEEAEALLSRIGLYEKRHSYPSRLSGGQQQRVAIVRALAMKPRLMLFDEVTSALDPELVHEVLVLMASLAAEGMTMLLVTHEIAFARDVSSRVLFFDKGVVAESGAPGILRNPQSERLQQFLHRILHDQFGSLGMDASNGGVLS